MSHFLFADPGAQALRARYAKVDALVPLLLAHGIDAEMAGLMRTLWPGWLE